VRERKGRAFADANFVALGRVALAFAAEKKDAFLDLNRDVVLG